MKTIVITQSAQKIKLTKPGQYTIILKNPGDEAEISGVFETQGQDSTQVEVIIHHRASRTQATTVLKGVARDQSQLKFVGRIKIDPDCGQSNSFLTERILLLSDQARAEVVPDLEILTDDVKCSHAASISNLNQAQVFYLMSRGLSQTQAEKIIVEGFLGSLQSVRRFTPSRQ